MTVYAYKDMRPQIHKTAYLAPGAQIIGDVVLGAYASVWFQTVIRGDLARISIGERSNVQDLCMCHSDENIPLTIGNRVTIGHGCVVHGCTIEEGCLIGMGAIVMNRAFIGKGSVIAAGAVVTENRNIPPYSLVTGVPARVKKTYENKKNMDMDMKKMSEHYVNTAQTFSSGQFYEIE